MFPRRMCRSILFPTYKFLNIAVEQMPCSNFATYSITNRSRVMDIENCFSRRFYSEKNDTPAPTADYNYIKQATNNSNILIVDVREPDEIKEHGKIPNSVNIPLGIVPAVFGQMSDKEFQDTFSRPKPTENTEIIFYCMIGKRSGRAQQDAINVGYKNTKNYLGSWTDWASRQ